MKSSTRTRHRYLTRLLPSWLLCSLILTGIIKPIETTVQHEQNNEEQSIVIFIHGTLSSLPLLKVLFALKIEHLHPVPALFDTNDGITRYGDLRTFHVFHQPLGKIGLTKLAIHTLENFLAQPLDVTELPPAALTVAQSYDYMNFLTHNKKKHSYYLYGWDGQLDNQERKQSALKLYDTLIEEREKNNRNGVKTSFIIVGHSHGGNIALNLHHAESLRKKKLFIETLVNLGCPVQSETENFIESEIFGKIYHLYSSGDLIQVLDTFSTKDFFSRRTFTHPKKNLSLKNVVQVEVKVDDLTPSHAELWFMGLSSLFYRKSLSIYPLPIVSFLPLILNTITLHAPEDRHVCISLQKKADIYECHLLDKNKKNKPVVTASFPSAHEWNTFIKKQSHLLTHHATAQRSYIQKILCTGGAFSFAGVIMRYLRTRK